MLVRRKRLSNTHLFHLEMVLTLAVIACATLLSSCDYLDERNDGKAVSLLAGMPAEGDGVPEPRKAATQCGYLWPNQYLDRGEEVYSCSRNARLVHQSDGNMVLYGPSGFIWTTWTNGRATTRFIMQRDGNLVLYNGGTPLWNSGTWGNDYAVLAIQDDCNMVIYTNTTPRRAIWAASWNNPYFKFCTPPANNVDVLSYMRNTSGLIFRDNVNGDIVKFYTNGDPNRFWYMKNPYDGRRWEQYYFDTNFIYLEKDNSWPDGGGDTSYVMRNGAWRWAKRYFSGVGDYVDSSFDVYGFNWNSCNAQYKWRMNTRKKLVYKNDNWTGGVFTNPVSLIILESVIMKSDFSARADWTEVERFWYAKGYGWIRWDHWKYPEQDWNNYNDIVNGCSRSSFCRPVIQYRSTTSSAPGFQGVCPQL